MTSIGRVVAAFDTEFGSDRFDRRSSKSPPQFPHTTTLASDVDASLGKVSRRSADNPCTKSTTDNSNRDTDANNHEKQPNKGGNGTGEAE
ncbi:MAG: hypothetical protein GY854_14950 [Deltaproteobacteria bacterium]|nr:hypothetical protein [Deltaproteobacteria bacterium]